ncbi:MAG: sigma-70 family RNA polymerase sigma factor [Deltaproteobacteria bacterium]
MATGLDTRLRDPRIYDGDDRPGATILASAVRDNTEEQESPLPVDPDLADIRLTLDGEGAAYERLVTRHQSRVAARMWKFTREKPDHEELVQEVFVQAYLSLPTYRGDAPFEHWLARISTRVGYRFLKRISADRRQDPLPSEELDRVAAEEPEHIDPKRGAELLHSLLGRLSARNRMVITLRYLEERSVEETAELIGWTQSMVKVQAWRARKQLKKLCQEAGLEIER